MHLGQVRVLDSPPACTHVVEDVGKLIEAELGEDIFGDAAQTQIRRAEPAHRRAEPRDRLVRLHLHRLERRAAVDGHRYSTGDILRQRVAE